MQQHPRQIGELRTTIYHYHFFGDARFLCMCFRLRKFQYTESMQTRICIVYCTEIDPCTMQHLFNNNTKKKITHTRASKHINITKYTCMSMRFEGMTYGSNPLHVFLFSSVFLLCSWAMFIRSTLISGTDDIEHFPPRSVIVLVYFGFLIFRCINETKVQLSSLKLFIS